ncbi:hypothetical protein CMP1-53 [Clavibacter phage CMP1]|uniref:Uncharacterized protein n=1 Tax=Clavibacter phage CMP1 TaxID=686439 RepID=D0U237_9CAUD|nr:hypothetical protein CMP1-53 [Clavibacter phage CMP1]ACY35967.1 hypothetical protein CMP1-53 [Clavibacter phage CMP1]
MDKTSYDKRTHLDNHSRAWRLGIAIYPRWAHFQRIGSVIRIYFGHYTISHRTGRE